jgi:serine/threonine-protein kinase
VRQVAESLAEVHRRNCVHFDVKPGNILIDQNGRYVLNDLGLGATVEYGNIVVAQGFRGTYEYAAPEQFVGWANARSDVFALGVILHEILTGQVLPRDWSRAVWPSQVHPGLNPTVDALVRTLANPANHLRPTAADAAGLLQRELRRITARAAMARQPLRAQRATAQQQFPLLGLDPVLALLGLVGFGILVSR